MFDIKISKKKSNLIFKKPPKIIAEISGNHAGNKKRFLNLIRSACMNGADLIKIQTYEPKDITIKSKSAKFRIKKGIWKNNTLWDLYKKAHTPFKWHKDAFEIAKKYKKIIFSSPFSIRAVDLLESLNCQIYKIASFEITDFKLIDYIASKNKPIILSTGMSSLIDIKQALKVINKYHNKVSILHCVSEYPTNIVNSDLKRILYLKKTFPKNNIGLSDHTDGISTSLIASFFGISYIEKHFKLDNFETADSLFSIKPDQLNELSKAIKYLSVIDKNRRKILKKNLFLRRSIYASKLIKKNQILNSKNINTFRPKIGICATKYFEVIGRKVNKNIKKNQPILFSDLI